MFQTISELQNKTNLIIDHFFIYPDIDCEKPFYQWILFVDNPTKADKTEVILKTDEILKKISEYYKIAREYDYINN